MIYLKMFGTSVFQILSLLFIVVHLVGVMNIYFSDKNNYCEMTYMFEYPQFVRISISENHAFPQYGLYAYSEGRHTERARKMWFDGIPVLYIPGNAGSYMQARSIASVALRKAISSGYDYHFDFFTISFNEELSGFYGGVLESQTEFTSLCITKILSLYKQNKYTKTVPTSVILIGHSMGGVIAKRLLAYPSTIETANMAITLAAPLSSPLINFDIKIDSYYKYMDLEWKYYIHQDNHIRAKKFLISLGSGPRDVLVPASYTSSNDSTVSGVTTAVPGVWVSPDHVSIVWCKQLILVINKYLFSLVDPKTNLLTNDYQQWTDKAKTFFKANRSMTLNPQIVKSDTTLQADAFWYEDNRRIYQISRPIVDRMTYLMIRLVNFPQNRFVAIESINLNEKDWVFGCNAKYVRGSYRHCKQATSLAELSRWTGAAANFNKRKVATIDLHDLKSQYADWTHVVVKVPPTRKPVVLNIDINDYSSRVINVNLPSIFSFRKHIIKEETEANSLYYELVLPGFNLVHEAYLLYVEPTESCKATQYHASAELHVPWADNYESYHYFTQLKKSPMKLRLFKSNPNITLGLDPTEHAKITLLLDPQCTYTISISTSWYHRIAQAVRNYSQFLYAYVAAILLLATSSCIQSLKEKGSCMSIHVALMREEVKPYYVLPLARLGTIAFTSIPLLSIIFETSAWKNIELQYFTKSLLVLPAYMTALGILNLSALAILITMVCSSQIAHRLFFRIVWRGRTKLAEKVAEGLQKVPMVVSAMLICAVPLSCGAAALAAGAAFYAFMLSKMYEEYLEDYVYKIMAKIGTKVCNIFGSKRNTKEKLDLNVETKELVRVSDTVKTDSVDALRSNEEGENRGKSIQNNEKNILKGDESTNKDDEKTDKDDKSTDKDDKSTDKDDKSTDKDDKIIVKDEITGKNIESQSLVCKSESVEQNNVKKRRRSSNNSNMDEDLNNLNFHMLMFLLWLIVTLCNVPALLTWAKNFKYSMVLKVDTSFNNGLVMSLCSTYIWQMNGPRKHLKYYDAVTSLLFTMAVFILAIGPYSVAVVNYGVTLMFFIITFQQYYDKEEHENIQSEINKEEIEEQVSKLHAESESNSNSSDNKFEKIGSESTDCNTEQTEKNSDNCHVCNENRIYAVFKNIKDKLSFNEDL